jgi:hypothetical protein
MSSRVSIPIGVVSKNDAGDRKTPVKAALNRLKLATKLASLIIYIVVNRNLVDGMEQHLRKCHTE